jgi:hypothetical protein
MTCVMKECETLVTSDILYSEHPVFLHSEYRSFFVPAIWHFIFRTSCIFTFRTSDIFCSGHPVFFIPDFRFLDYGHPDFIRQTGCRYGLLRPMFVKKRWDEKGLPRIILAFTSLSTSCQLHRQTSNEKIDVFTRKKHTFYRVKKSFFWRKIHLMH